MHMRIDAMKVAAAVLTASNCRETVSLFANYTSSKGVSMETMETPLVLPLEAHSGSRNSVQTALLHQQLVANATCVVMVGGQGHTLNQYAHLHRGHECYSLKLRECTTHRYMTELSDLIHNAV